MRKPIYANKEHEIIIENYMIMMKEFVKDVANDVRWKNYLEVFSVVIDFHNNYGRGSKEHNYWDWLMILPINLSVMTNGFLAGIETKRNKTLVHSYRILLSELMHDVVDKIEKLEPIDD